MNINFKCNDLKLFYYDILNDYNKLLFKLFIYSHNLNYLIRHHNFKLYYFYQLINY